MEYPNKKLIRLHVFLRNCGLGSRRKCEEYIIHNRVCVNEIIINTIGVKIQYEDEVRVDNKKVFPHQEKIYLALNKPMRYLCSNYDQKRRKLASHLLVGMEKYKLFHVGRLDYLSTGLIFYTNDGIFANTVAHPSFLIEKDYTVEATTKIDVEYLNKFKFGIKIKNTYYQIQKYYKMTENCVILTLNEGKNREIRKVFDFFGIEIKNLQRTRIGIVNINGIKLGQFRFLFNKEVDWFLKKHIII